MGQLLINTVTGFTVPFSAYTCDVYGNQCVLVTTIYTPIPPSIFITLPIQFNTAPAIGIKLTDALGCEKFEIYNC